METYVFERFCDLGLPFPTLVGLGERAASAAKHLLQHQHAGDRSGALHRRPTAVAVDGEAPVRSISRLATAEDLPLWHGGSGLGWAGSATEALGQSESECQGPLLQMPRINLIIYMLTLLAVCHLKECHRSSCWTGGPSRNGGSRSRLLCPS